MMVAFAIIESKLLEHLFTVFSRALIIDVATLTTPTGIEKGSASASSASSLQPPATTATSTAAAADLAVIASDDRFDIYGSGDISDISDTIRSEPVINDHVVLFRLTATKPLQVCLLVLLGQLSCSLTAHFAIFIVFFKSFITFLRLRSTQHASKALRTHELSWEQSQCEAALLTKVATTRLLGCVYSGIANNVKEQPEHNSWCVMGLTDQTIIVLMYLLFCSGNCR